MKDLILVCNDLFGLEVWSLLETSEKWHDRYGLAQPYRVIGYISDKEDPFEGLGTFLKRLGPIDGWKPVSDEKYIMALKMPDEKQKTAEYLKAQGCEFETFISPWMLNPGMEAGEGSVAAAYSVKAGLKIGKFATLIDPLIACHAIGDYSTIMHFSNITADVGSHTYVGNHVYSHTDRVIGDDVTAEDGSIIVKNVKSGMTVAGVPARRIKK